MLKEGLKMLKRTIWNSSTCEPIGLTVNRLLYSIRQDDKDEDLILDSITEKEILEDSDGVIALDALTTPYQQLERKMDILYRVMVRQSPDTVTPIAKQITAPFKKNGVVNVAVIFELKDGQTISIFFHNPDTTPSKLAPQDVLISWKWLLNKKDVTIVVAPERGEDIKVQEVARRIMKLADKNSAAFQRQNKRRAERLANIEAQKKANAELEAKLNQLTKDIEAAEIELEDAKIKNAEVTERFNDWRAQKVKEAGEEALREAEEKRKADEARKAEEAAKKAEAERTKETLAGMSEDEKFLRGIIDRSIDANAPGNMDKLEKIAEAHDSESDPLMPLLNDALNVLAAGTVNKAMSVLAAAA